MKIESNSWKLKLEVWMSHRKIPVSYTHLDVYKRQEQERKQSNAFSH